MKHTVITVALLASCIWFAGCATDDGGGAPTAQKKSYPTPPDHAKTATVHFPLKVAHQAAEDSLAVSGFKVKQNDDVFLEGARPHHMGLFIGSGGEVCRIWLNPTAPDETEIKVDSIKTFVGMVGQKEWDSTVLAEIIRDLNK